MKNSQPMPVFFHELQLLHKPRYEWAFGEKIEHPETTRRAEAILAELSGSKEFEMLAPKTMPIPQLNRTHDPCLMRIYQKAQDLDPSLTFSPSVFPKRNQVRGNPENLSQAGFYCFDSGTPLTSTTWDAAVWSAGCAVEATNAVAKGSTKIAYALCRPPGHHATRDLFGGYCYFNNAALSAKIFRRKGRVAVLDIDFHHGNGTQDLFYSDPKVLVVSVHGDPREFYPFFSGYPEETGTGRGKGFNINLPLPGGCDSQEFIKVLCNQALSAISTFQPSALVVSAGFDTFEGDPIGRFKLKTEDFFEVGEHIGRLGLPTAVLQEGGYAAEELGRNVATFLRGLRHGSEEASTVKIPQLR